MRLRSAMLLFVVLLANGCATYEFDLTRPAELSQHIGRKTDAVVSRPPLEYRLLAVEGWLVMRIHNQTDSPITLLGDRSTVVDPSGQSHPLLSQTMAPGSFIKVILPPPRPRIERTGPSIGIGVGTIVRGPRYRGYGLAGYPDYYDEPRYFYVYDNNAIYWDWSGETDIRLTLVYQQGERTFEHEFVFAKRKV